MRVGLFFLFIFFSQVVLKAQTIHAEFKAPLNIPLVLNGNFGELRSNHFHAGIDLKTNGETGLPVFSIEEGFVSRVAVSPTGYGNVIYIDHPSGYTSVYGHLDTFYPKLAEWVKEQQYKNKSFQVNLHPDKNQFKVSSGQEIAKSGNSGSSAGPHLHFELRKTANQNPVNPLFFNFDIKDETKPVVEHLFVYPLGENSHVQNKTTPQQYKLVYYGNSYHLKGIQSLNFYGEIGFGVDAIDYLDNNWSKCGIYQLELWIDNKLIYTFELDELSYSTMRYMNSHIDYASYKSSRKKVHKTYIEPGNKLDIYKLSENRGIYNFTDGKRHKVQIILYDAYMNASEIEFYAQGTQPVKHQKVEHTTAFSYDKENSLQKNNFSVTVPKGALYSDINFLFQEGKKPEDAYSPLFRVHQAETPLHTATEVKIKAENLDEDIADKALIALFDIKSGKYSSIGGEYENGWVTTTTRTFGDMCIVVDSISPVIQPLSIRSNNTLMEKNRIRFKINDNLTGINEYTGKIDNKWVLFEYDAKRDLLVYYFDDHIKSGKNHKLVLSVTDNKNNTNEYEATFYY